MAQLSKEPARYVMVVFTTVSLLSAQGNSKLETFEKEVQLFPEAIECYTMAGTWDYMLKVVAKDIRHEDKKHLGVTVKHATMKSQSNGGTSG